MKETNENKLVPFPQQQPAAPTVQQLRVVPDFQMKTETEREISFVDLFRALKQRAYLIAGITAGFAAIMGLYCITRDPLYTAGSVIEIRGYAPVLSGATAETLYGADTRKLEYQKTTIAKLKQPGIADRVLSRNPNAFTIAGYFEMPLQSVPVMPQEPANVISSDIRRQGLQQSSKLVALYLNVIDINPISETSLVEIDVTTRDPRISMMIANAHAEGFIEELRLERQESMRTNLKALEAQVSDLKGRLSHAEEEVARYSAENHLILGSGSDAKDVTLQKIVALSDLLSQATQKRVQSENLYNQLKDAPIASASSLDNDSIQQWRFELNKLEGDYNALGQKVTAEYPEMIDLKSRIDSLKRSINNERAQLINALGIRLQSERAAEERLSSQIALEEGQVHDNLKKMARFTVLRKEADSLRELYEAVLKQLQETTVSAASGVSNIFVSNWANEPQSPSYPRTGLLMVLATMVGFGFAVLIAWTLEYFDNRMKSSEEAAHLLDLPLLGILPSFEKEKAQASPLDKLKLLLPSGESQKPEPPANEPAPAPTKSPVTISRPNVMVSEALKTIRAGLLLSSVDYPMRSIMITSAEKGEGKTTIAANLAISLAQAEYRTLLIDADLRETSLVKFFPDIAQRRGLSDLMAGQATPEETVVRQVVPHLDVLGAGTRPPNPAEIVGSKKMRDTISRLREHYDFIIVDSPPVLPVADSLMLSSTVDAVLIVTRAGKTLRRNAREARRRLARVRANVIGLVVNGTNSRHEPMYGNDQNMSYFTVVDHAEGPGIATM